VGEGVTEGTDVAVEVAVSEGEGLAVGVEVRVGDGLGVEVFVGDAVYVPRISEEALIAASTIS
jgi:hypothetical protein